MGSDNPFAYGSASWSKLGADSPFKGATGIGQTDWGSMGSSDYWKGGFDVDKTGSFGSGPSPFGGGSGANWGQALGKAVSWLGQSRKKAEQDDFMSKVPRALGRGTEGFGGQVLDNLGVVFPPQQAPIYIPGVQQGGGGKGSQIGQLAGTAAGLAASALIPGVGPMIGASIGGSLGGGIGGLFG